MSKDAATHELSGSPASRHAAGRRLLPAVVLLMAALAFLARSTWLTLQKPRAEALLRLGDDVALTTPPGVAIDDTASLRARLEPLGAVWELVRAPAAEPRDLLGAARQAGLAGDNLLARECLKAVLSRQQGEDLVVLDALGRTNLLLARFGEAQTVYQRLRRLLPHDVRGLLGECRALSGLGRNAEAVAVLERARTTLSPADLPGRLDLAAEFSERGDLPRALECAQAALALAPRDPRAALATARALYNLRRTKEAERILTPIVNANPGDVRSRVLLATILNSPLHPKRDPARAEHHLLAAAETAPHEVEPLQRLGELFREQDRHRQAAFVYARLLEISPDSTVARMQFASALRSLGEERSAAEQRAIAQSLVERDRKEEKLVIRRNQRPTDPSPRLEIARFYEDHGRLGRAFGELQAAFALSDGDAKSHDGLKRLYERIGLRPPRYLKEAAR